MTAWLDNALRALNAGPTTTRVFTWAQLKKFHATQKQAPGLPASVTATRLVEALVGAGSLREITISPDRRAKAKDGTPYKKIVRYVRGDANSMELALSLRAGSYLSHGTAAEIHGLLPPSRILYVNKEQTPKITKSLPLTQQAIDLAFTYSPRISNLVYEYDGRRIVLIGGKNTGNLEVTNQSVPSPIAYTRIERTLIDITVRPICAGGVGAVIQAFKNAAGRISLFKLLEVLRQLNYVYPYHQALGYYLSQAGYESKETRKLRNLGMNFDFYLAHGMKERDFVSEWRIHVPKNV